LRENAERAKETNGGCRGGGQSGDLVAKCSCEGTTNCSKGNGLSGYYHLETCKKKGITIGQGFYCKRKKGKKTGGRRESPAKE